LISTRSARSTLRLVGPSLYVLASPHRPGSEAGEGLREVRAAHQSVSLLPCDAEQLGDLGCSHKLRHAR
jgi:hypothetical protein